MNQRTQAVDDPATRIRVLIVDDEPLARAGLRRLVARDRELEIIGECGDGLSALTAIQDLRPDLLLLDIQMPELNGFEILRALGPDAPPCVVFITAYDRFALRAFEVAAVDYLVKPFDDDRFEQTLQRAKHALRSHNVAALEARLNALLARVGDAEAMNAATSAESLKRLVVRDQDRIIVVRTEEIDWIEAADYYSRLHVGARTHLLRESMTALESRLDPKRFFRTHRSAIVNLDRVAQILSGNHGEHLALLHDGTRLRLSRGRREALQQRLAL